MGKDEIDINIDQLSEGSSMPEELAADPQPANPQPAEASEAAKAEEEMEQLKEAIIEQAREDERPMSATFSLRKILGGDWLTADLLRRQLGVLLLIVIFIIIYRIGYNQSSASMVIFEESYVVRDYGFLVLPVQLFSIFNPLFCQFKIFLFFFNSNIFSII